MTKDNMIGVKVDKATKEAIAEELEYGDSMSEWVREAIERRLIDEDIVSRIESRDQ